MNKLSLNMLSQIAWTLAGLAVAAFFSVVTYLIIEKLPEYEQYWIRGSDDFNAISQSIQDLTATTEPFVEKFPELVEHVGRMEKDVSEMKLSVGHMQQSVGYIGYTMPQQMDAMNWNVHRMRNKMSPQGMMGSMMPW